MSSNKLIGQRPHISDIKSQVVLTAVQVAPTAAYQFISFEEYDYAVFTCEITAGTGNYQVRPYWWNPILLCVIPGTLESATSANAIFSYPTYGLRMFLRLEVKDAGVTGFQTSFHGWNPMK